MFRQGIAARGFHGSWPRPRTDSEVRTVITESASGDFRALAIQIREAGLLDRRPGYYSVKVALTIGALAAGWATMVIIGDLWATLGVAAFLGVMFTQVAMVGHDAGHQQVFRSRRANWLLGLIVANALIGLSFGWWVPKHNAHHGHPNEVDRDPDMGDGLPRWQARLFFPLMVLRSTGMHVYGVARLLQQRNRAAAVEGLLIAAHIALYLTAVLWVLSPTKALVFIAVQQAVFSLYLGCSFAPNHKGMPVIDGGTEMSFVRRQVMTARNITGGRFTTLLLGGLNYQIEHHLFPTMPRPNLARAQGIIRPFCIESGLGYCEDTLLGSYRQIVRHLRTGATTALVPPRVMSTSASYAHSLSIASLRPRGR